MGDQVLCSICTAAPSTVFCPCQPQTSFLCQLCIPSHCQQLPVSLHDFCTVADWPYVSQITPEVFKNRKLSIAQGIALLELMQRYEEEDYTAAIASIDNLFQQIKFLMDSLHTTLVIAFEELRKNVEKTLYEEVNPEMIEFILRNGQVMQTTRMKLYEMEALKEVETLRELVTMTISTFQTQDFTSYILTKMKQVFLTKGASSASLTRQEAKDEVFIPVLRRNILRKYYAGSSGHFSLIEYPLKTKVDHESAYAMMANGELFCCGGVKSGKQSYYIGMHSSKVTILPNMGHGRSCPGVISYNNLPYVFGGRSGTFSLSSCERLTPTDTWEAFPTPMSRPRCSFSPVMYNSVIYLPGGTNASTIEVFEPARMSFRTMQLTLPHEGKNLAFASGDSLYVLVGSDLMCVDLRNENKAISSSSLKTEIVSWSPIAPIVSHGQVLFWGFEDSTISSFFRRTFGGMTHGVCYVYDIGRKALREVERFEYSSSDS